MHEELHGVGYASVGCTTGMIWGHGCTEIAAVKSAHAHLQSECGPDKTRWPEKLRNLEIVSETPPSFDPNIVDVIHTDTPQILVNMEEWSSARVRMNNHGRAMIGLTTGRVWGVGRSFAEARLDAKKARKDGVTEKMIYASLSDELPMFCPDLVELTERSQRLWLLAKSANGTMCKLLIDTGSPRDMLITESNAKIMGLVRDNDIPLLQFGIGGECHWSWACLPADFMIDGHVVTLSPHVSTSNHELLGLFAFVDHDELRLRVGPNSATHVVQHKQVSWNECPTCRASPTSSPAT